MNRIKTVIAQLILLADTIDTRMAQIDDTGGIEMSSVKQHELFIGLREMAETGLFMHVDDLVKDEYGNLYASTWPGVSANGYSPVRKEYYCVIEINPTDGPTEYVGNKDNNVHINVFYSQPLTNNNGARERAIIFYAGHSFTIYNANPMGHSEHFFNEVCYSHIEIRRENDTMVQPVEIVKTIYLQRHKDYVKP